MNKAFQIFILIALAAGLAFAQKPKAAAKPTTKSSGAGKQVSGHAKTATGKKSASKDTPVKKAIAKKSPAKDAPVKKPIVKKPDPEQADPDADKKAFDRALAAPTTAEKAKRLRAFLAKFPESELKDEAIGYLVTARAVVGDEAMRAADIPSALASFKLAIAETPDPASDRLFNDVLLKIPGNLFYGGHRPAAMEMAAAIEKKVAANPKQLLSVAAFYLGVENGAEARRVAEAAIALDPGSAAAHQALGLAHRLNFDLDEAAKAYAKAAEVDPSSVSARRSLAEMNRALGKPEAAAAIYREIMAANANDPVARQGLVLSLFDLGRQKEAETELAALLEIEPKTFSLLTSVAYWYAANDQGEKSAEYAQKAIDIEPRYIWSHIVLARGLMTQNKPVEAERVLLRARQYGNFPTLDYEIASARYQAGFYREAAEELRKNFSVRDGLVGTKLGGRIYKEEKGFQDLIAHERRASILQPLPADKAEAGEKLRLLLELTRKIEKPSDEGEIAVLADEFVKGDDRMKIHRQLFVADLLLQKNVAVSKAAELVKSSVGNSDAGLDVAAPGAAVMASELYESRSTALSRNEVIVIPEVPRQMLSSILRGRIEGLAGWTAYQQGNYPDAIVRLRRSISVLPDKSAWWRLSLWRLGSALEADGKDKEALDSYIRSYVTDRPNAWKYGAIAGLYRKVNGGTDGLEEKIGANPLTASTGAETAAPRVDPASSGAASEPPPGLTASVRPVPQAVSPNPEIQRIPEPVPPARTEPSERIIPEKKPEPEPAPTPFKEPDRNTLEPKAEPVDKQLPPSGVNTEAAAETSAAAKDQPKVAESRPDTIVNDGRPIGESVRPAGEKDKNASTEIVKTEPPVETKTQVEEKPSAVKEASAEMKQTEIKVPEPRAVSTPAPPPVSDSSGQNLPGAETASAQPTPDEMKEPKTIEQPKPTSEPAINKLPVRTDTEKAVEPAPGEPVNLLRDPFASVDAQPVKSAEETEKKPRIIVSDPFGSGDKPAKPKDLFDPVIIKVASAEGSKTDAAGAQRSRVIAGKEVVSDQRCSIEVSQESIMLLSGGGSLGLRVSIDGDGDLKDISASSASPRDIEVRAEPLIEGVTGRRFYVIKSISDRTGVFQVNLESPCGKREVRVHVR